MAPIDPEDQPIIHIERISQYVPLPPVALNSALPAICAEVFSPLLLNYYPPVKGVVLAYEDVQLSSRPPKPTATSKSSSRRRKPAADNDDDSDGGSDEDGVVLTKCVDEYMAPYVWATASLLVWRPAPGCYLGASVTHQSGTHITLSHLNAFAITILKEYLPGDWEWSAKEANKKKKGFDGRIADEGGAWVDGDGVEVFKGKEFRVRVREWDVKGGKGKGVWKVDGSLLSAEEEKSRAAKKAGKAGKAAAGRNGASGEVVEVD
ncbi:hypothetical protein BU23DRAFT_554738 [Bimuria novae-zelandiae CBS 107.79]|uniref:DNA-directed RNA polymerase subunit n=1 Tax=Bimuria novae-zelandiae CBS 107.79 TaxID=1447943 RepID=A0A6A5V7T0_9PLEO|nr:hypothetical protein BU23DRAFT_554738 [Bimuria novae-zelandiae CBS 107.79]